MNKIFEQNLFTRQALACTMFESAIGQGKLAHAYLLCGRAEADKLALSLQLAAFLNCQALDKGQLGSCLRRQSGASASNQIALCQNCRWIQEGKHPGAYLFLDPEENKSGKIAVEKSRELSQELAKTSPYFRIVVITQASEEVLHRASANALLKTIEEPGPQCLFLLFAVNRQEVLATILSRCQEVPFLGEMRQVEASEYQEAGAEIAEAASFLIDPETKTAHLLAATLSLSGLLIALSDKELEPEKLVDLTLAFIYEKLRSHAGLDGKCQAYMADVFAAGDETKAQINHYVSVKGSLEAFCLRLKDCYLRYCDKRKLEPKVSGK